MPARAGSGSLGKWPIPKVAISPYHIVERAVVCITAKLAVDSSAMGSKSANLRLSLRLPLSGGKLPTVL